MLKKHVILIPAVAMACVGMAAAGDGVAQLGGEVLERLAGPREAVALELGDRRGQWRGLGRRRQRLDLGLREDGLQPEVCAWLVGPELG